ncbi:hypothetical protein ACHQM5_020369 [Ranunculus cassubicifolius]
MGDDKNETTIGGAKVLVKQYDGKENFTLWQRRMRNILIQQELLFVLEGKEKKPATMTDEAWALKDQKASSSIELYLADEVMFNVMEETTAQGTWEKLEKLYMGKSLSNKLFLKDELLNLRMDEGGDVMEHLNTFNRCYKSAAGRREV